MSSAKPRIAIVGGGPAGLTLGVLLQNHRIPCTIFELRQKPTEADFAKPAGSLDLHEESGLAAIRECGLYDEFLPLTGVCSEDTKIVDKDGNVTYADFGEDSSRPEISRHSLTKLLMSHFPTDALKWGHKLVSATKSTSNDGHVQTELDFGVNGKHSFDLVIGADGAWSRVRNLLTNVKPTYSGIQVITATVRQITQHHPQLAEFVGRGTFMALAGGHAVTSQRGVQDSVRLYIFLSSKEEQYATTSGLAGKTASHAKDQVLSDDALMSNWGTQMKKLVSVACDAETADNPGSNVDIKPLYMLPVGHIWENQPGFTVIGDAAHLMGPWAGEGVNLAMADSLSLARAITKAYDTTGSRDTASFMTALGPLMRDFELEMWNRSKEKAEETFRNGQMMFGEDGAAALAKLLQSYGPPPED